MIIFRQELSAVFTFSNDKSSSRERRRIETVRSYLGWWWWFWWLFWWWLWWWNGKCGTYNILMMAKIIIIVSINPRERRMMETVRSWLGCWWSWWSNLHQQTWLWWNGHKKRNVWNRGLIMAMIMIIIFSSLMVINVITTRMPSSLPPQTEVMATTTIEEGKVKVPFKATFTSGLKEW